MSEIAFSQEYERRAYDPPMPVLDIGVSRPGSRVPSATLEVIVDTGADGTLIARDVLERVDATSSSTALICAASPVSVSSWTCTWSRSISAN